MTIKHIAPTASSPLATHDNTTTKRATQSSTLENSSKPNAACHQQDLDQVTSSSVTQPKWSSFEQAPPTTKVATRQEVNESMQAYYVSYACKQWQEVPGETLKLQLKNTFQQSLEQNIQTFIAIREQLDTAGFPCTLRMWRVAGPEDSLHAELLPPASTRSPMGSAAAAHDDKELAGLAEMLASQAIKTWEDSPGASVPLRLGATSSNLENNLTRLELLKTKLHAVLQSKGHAVDMQYTRSGFKADAFNLLLVPSSDRRFEQAEAISGKLYPSALDVAEDMRRWPGLSVPVLLRASKRSQTMQTNIGRLQAMHAELEALAQKENWPFGIAVEYKLSAMDNGRAIEAMFHPRLA